MLPHIPFNLLTDSTSTADFEIEAGATGMLARNATSGVLTITMAYDSDAPWAAVIGDSKRVEFAEGTGLASFAVERDQSLSVAAGSEDVSVNVHSIVALPA